MDSPEPELNSIPVNLIGGTDGEVAILVARYDEYMLKSKARASWVRVDWAVSIAAQLMRVMHSVARNNLPAKHKGKDTIVRFYNDSVGFILGERRSIRIEQWASIIDGHAGFRARIADISNAGSYNAGGNPFVGKSDAENKLISTGGVPYGPKSVTTNSTGNPLIDLKLRNDLLSYGLPEILRMWISRENGINDMLHTLVAFAQLYARPDNSNPLG